MRFHFGRTAAGGKLASGERLHSGPRQRKVYSANGARGISIKEYKMNMTHVAKERGLAALLASCLTVSFSGMIQQAWAAETLQDLVDQAAPGSTLQIPAGTYDGLVVVDKDLVLQGAGAGQTILDGGRTNSVFIIKPGRTVVINDMTITRGADTSNPWDPSDMGYGGGAIKNLGHLTINRCWIQDSFSEFGPATGLGGGISNYSDGSPVSLTMNDCAIRRNSAGGEGSGGGIYSFPGIPVTLNRCTVSGNSSSYGGGGGITGGDPLTLNHCTVSGNRAYEGAGGGISAHGIVLRHCTITQNTAISGDPPWHPQGGGGIYGSVAECFNTILAGNISARDDFPDCNGSIVSFGYNLIGDSRGCSMASSTGDLIGTGANPINPRLGPLQDNGGNTETHALLADSPALDQGSRGDSVADQRGVRRPLDLPSIANAADGSDIGAYELASDTPPANQPPTLSALPDLFMHSGTSSGPLAVTVADAETPSSELILTHQFSVLAGDSSPSPVLEIVLGGTGAERTVTLHPAAGWIGAALITLTITDPQGTSSSDTFLLSVIEPYLAKTASPVSMPILDNQEGAFSSSIGVTGLSGSVKQVRVILRQLSHTYPQDIWLVLLSPDRRPALLMSAAGGGYDLADVTLQFDDAATASLPRTSRIASGTYRSTGYNPHLPFWYEGYSPDQPPTTLAGLAGANPNGRWDLLVFDSQAYDQGALAGGWSLEIITEENSPPELSPDPLPDLVTLRNTATDLLVLNISDRESEARWLTVSAHSDDPDLFSPRAFQWGGQGGQRTLIITPEWYQTGTTRVHVRVSDGVDTITRSFQVTVREDARNSLTFSRNATIEIPDQGPASIYPATIYVHDVLDGAIEKMNITLHGLRHTWPEDIRVLLVSPGGLKALVAARAGHRTPIQDVTLQLQDDASAILPLRDPLQSGIFKPTSYGPGNSLPPPAPPAPYATDLSVFQGASPRGVWQLYIVDDFAYDQGQLRRGYSLTFLTNPAPPPK